MPPFSVRVQHCCALTHNTNKNSRPQWDGRKFTRGTTQIHLPSTTLRTMHFVPTNIGFPDNAGIAVRTTKHDTWNLTPDTLFTRTAREGTSTAFGRVQFHQLPCTSLAASVSLLSSVTALMWLLSAESGFCQGAMRNNTHPALVFGGIQGKVRFAHEVIQVGHGLAEHGNPNTRAD